MGQDAGGVIKFNAATIDLLWMEVRKARLRLEDRIHEEKNKDEIDRLWFMKSSLMGMEGHLIHLTTAIKENGEEL